MQGLHELTPEQLQAVNDERQAWLCKLYDRGLDLVGSDCVTADEWVIGCKWWSCFDKKGLKTMQEKTKKHLSTKPHLADI
jgi:hypothetical protein